MDGSYGWIVWMDRMDGSYGWIMWVDHMGGSYGRVTWVDHTDGNQYGGFMEQLFDRITVPSEGLADNTFHTVGASGTAPSADVKLRDLVMMKRGQYRLAEIATIESFVNKQVYHRER